MAEQFLTLMADLDDIAQARMSGWYRSLQDSGASLSYQPVNFSPGPGEGSG